MTKADLKAGDITRVFLLLKVTMMSLNIEPPIAHVAVWRDRNLSRSISESDNISFALPNKLNFQPNCDCFVE